VSNRRKAKKPWLGRAGTRRREVLGIAPPPDEKEVLKTVPAKVGDEVVGKAILYSDGTTDVIFNDEISDKAKAMMGDVVVAFNKETGKTFTVEGITGKDF